MQSIDYSGGDKTETRLESVMKTMMENPLISSGLLEETQQFEELMMMYECAIREVKTKLEVLNAEFSIRYRRNPIASIESRVKSPMSIFRKLRHMEKTPTLDSISRNLYDVAGVRVICNFIDDIYFVSRMLSKQDDITVLRVKDYIRNPKEGGYRSYHMIVEIPVFFSTRKQAMKVEIQFRTIAMDFWASLEHQIRYKKDIEDIAQFDEISRQLKEAADVIAKTDLRMQEIRNQIEHYQESHEKAEEIWTN